MNLMGELRTFSKGATHCIFLQINGASSKLIVRNIEKERNKKIRI